MSDYKSARRAHETTRAYGSDWRMWERFLAHRELSVEAATDADLSQYLALRARAGHASTSLARAASGISGGYVDRGYPRLRGAETAAVLAGIRSRHGSTPRHAEVITASVLRIVVDAIAHQGAHWRDIRDRALLLVAWQGALRRSEAIALDWDDVRIAGDGAVLELRRSKGERGGARADVVLCAATNPAHCPIGALRAWRARRGAAVGAVFVSASGARLHASSMSKILFRRVSRAGLDARQFSPHSLRAGFLTSAALAGASVWRLREHARHKRVGTLDLYVRGARLLETHPGQGLL